MKILITGATGFIGTNLVNRLNCVFGNLEIYAYNSKSTIEEMDLYARDCNFVFYLAAVHRSNDESNFKTVNYDLLSHLIEQLEKNDNLCPIVFTSSRQAVDNTAYGISKRNSEDILLEYRKRNSAKVLIYRLTNTFGRYARPNVHSVVATFCYNIQRGIPITINDRSTLLNLYYIDDVIGEMVNQFISFQNTNDFTRFNDINRLPDDKIFTVTLGELADKLYAFKLSRQKGLEPIAESQFDKLLLYTFDGYAE